jgi:protein-tyrosine-phosphatase
MWTIHRFWRVQKMLDGLQRGVHLQLSIERALGLRKDTDALVGPVRSVLFVCHGNVMRSAFAEEYFRRLIDIGSHSTSSIAAHSAGVFATPGARADPRAEAFAASLHLSLERHRARMISPSLVAASDLICVMDHFNETICVARFPRAKRQIMLLGTLGRTRGQPVEIDDPFLGTPAEIAESFRRIKIAVEVLVRCLAPAP